MSLCVCVRGKGGVEHLHSDCTMRAIVLTMFLQALELCMQQRAVASLNADLIVNCNNTALLSNVTRALRQYNATRTVLVWIGKNACYQTDPLRAMDAVLPMLKQANYECTVHLHPGVFVNNVSGCLAESAGPPLEQCTRRVSLYKHPLGVLPSRQDHPLNSSGDGMYHTRDNSAPYAKTLCVDLVELASRTNTARNTSTHGEGCVRVR